MRPPDSFVRYVRQFHVFTVINRKLKSDALSIIAGIR
jgi:hypothetical protein